MINNKTIKLSEQRNVAIANLNLAIKRCIEAEQGESPESFQLAEQVLEENQATVLSINEMIHRNADDYTQINLLESSFGAIKAKLKQREMQIIELQAELENIKAELADQKEISESYKISTGIWLKKSAEQAIETKEREYWIEAGKEDLDKATAENHVLRQALATEKLTNETLARRVVEQSQKLLELQAIFKDEVPDNLMDVLIDIDAEGIDLADECQEATCGGCAR